MRVVKVVSNGAVPYDRRVWLEATTLASAGHDVTVVCPRDRKAPERRLELDGVTIERYWLPFEGSSAPGLAAEFVWSFIAVALAVLRLRRRAPIDVFHVANPPETFWPIARVLQRRGTRFVFDHHDLSPEMYVARGGGPGGPVHRALSWMERQTLRSADLVISANETYARLAAVRGSSDGRTAVVRSAPDFSAWTVHERDPAVARGRRFVVGFLGEMGAQDGIEHLLEAAAVLRAQRDDIQYLLIGDGPHERTLHQHAERLGLGDRVTFTGRRTGDDLCRLMSSMDLGVAPDPKSDWSDASTINKIMDYMFFSLPTVSYRLTESMVTAGPDSALFVDGDEPAALADGIATLLDDPARRESMGGAGRRRVEDHLGWDKSALALLAAYERIADSGSDPE